MRQGWIITCAALALAACSSVERAPAGSAKPSSEQSLSDNGAEIKRLIEETDPILADYKGDDGERPHIPAEIDRRVLWWLKYFTEREREMTQRYLERGEALRPHLEAILKENEVPVELFYVAMIESGFVTSAKSRAKAVGIWQFVPGTGRNYGMAINKSVDERRNWIKATDAAIAYLKDLHNVFGSWYLALGAYNAGEYRIVRSIMKGKTRDFWLLAEQGLLPQETMDYVPKFLAAHIVGKHYKRLGFELKMEPEEQWGPWEAVSVPAGVKLRDLAKTTGVARETLERWNLDLLRGTTPFSKTGSVDIYLPKQELPKFEAAKAEIAGLRRYLGDEDDRRQATGKADKRTFQFYVVRKGDNLSLISKKIGTSTRALMRINGLKRGRIHPGQRLKFYANPPPAKKAPKKKRSREPAQTGANERGARGP